MAVALGSMLVFCVVDRCEERCPSRPGHARSLRKRHCGGHVGILQHAQGKLSQPNPSLPDCFSNEKSLSVVHVKVSWWHWFCMGWSFGAWKDINITLTKLCLQLLNELPCILGSHFSTLSSVELWTAQLLVVKFFP